MTFKLCNIKKNYHYNYQIILADILNFYMRNLKTNYCFSGPVQGGFSNRHAVLQVYHQRKLRVERWSDQEWCGEYSEQVLQKHARLSH